MLKAQIEQDLKTALLGGDGRRVRTLRGLKSAILYVEVAQGVRDKGLSDDKILGLLVKEVKKRQESAQLYEQGGNNEKRDEELAEKAIIEQYLPAQMSEEEIVGVVESTIAELNAHSVKEMGQVIAAVKQKTTGSADGGVVARLVKERLRP